MAKAKTLSVEKIVKNLHETIAVTSEGGEWTFGPDDSYAVYAKKDCLEVSCDGPDGPDGPNLVRRFKLVLVSECLEE